MALVAYHLNTAADNILDTLTHYAPAEFLVVVVFLLLALGLLIGLTYRIPLKSKSDLRVGSTSDPVTGPPSRRPDL